MTLRRESADARILVVNHHLLFADLAARSEGAATSFFSKEWSRMGINRALGRLYRKRRAREAGLLPRLGLLPPEIPGAVTRVREAAEKADAAALALCGSEGLFRLTPEKVKTAGDLLFPQLYELKRAISALTDQVFSFVENTDQEDPAVREIRAILRRLESAGVICASFLEYGDRASQNDVFWLEKQSGSQDPWAVFSVTPVTIAPSLRDALFDANKTVICVSATLSSTGSAGNRENGDPFRFWADRTGAALAEREFLREIFPSPFPYAQRTILAIPSDAPLPDSPEYQAFISQAVTDLIRISGGSALVLFTSYQSLRSTYEDAAPVLEKEGIRCLKQGDDDRTRLLQHFLEDKTSVLFGTDSFWEGVDAPGDTLRLVIICRLPFRTLKDPVFEARREFLEKRGRNSFAELSLPDAVMRFKQGFGRLMRSSADCGMVAVLDGRILRKYYGAVFVGSLPETKQSFKDISSLLRDLDQFLY
jgi:ATP-dependent DNA helicase DinG